MGLARFLLLGLLGLASASVSNHSLQAQVIFSHHRHVRPFYPPSVVWGRVCYPRITTVNCVSTGIWGGSFYRGFYPLHGGLWPSYSFYSCPKVVAAPVFYRPVVYTPVYYDSFYCNPIVTTWSLSRATATPTPIGTRQPLYADSQRTKSLNPTSAQFLVEKKTRHVAPGTSPHASAFVTTYSPIWTQSAVGLIDNMMERGEWQIAHQSLEGMEKISTPLTHRVLLRQAVMDLVANRESLDVARIDRVMDRLAEAAEAGSPFSPNEFRGASLSDYLRASDIDLNPILDQLAQRVLQQPGKSGREMMLLSVLLKLDGQQDRARLFAKESRTLAARSDTFRWKSVLRSLDRPVDDDALLVAK